MIAILNGFRNSKMLKTKNYDKEYFSILGFGKILDLELKPI